MKKIKILVDMDGVLCDYTKHFLKKAIERGAPEKKLSECTFFKMNSNFEEKYHELIKGIECEVGFFENHPAVKDAIDSMHKMEQDERIDLFICTTPKKQYQNCVGEKYA